MRWGQMLGGVHVRSWESWASDGAVSEAPGLCPALELDGDRRNRLGGLRGGTESS